MSFKLIGFHNPFGYYPARVLPVGRVRHKTVVMAEDGTELPVPVDSPDFSIFRVRSRKFDPGTVRVIAVSRGKHVEYRATEEEQVVSDLLSDPVFAIENPYARLDFALSTRESRLVLTELTLCVLHLAWVAPRPAVEAWYQARRQRLRSRDWFTERLGEHHRCVLELLERQLPRITAVGQNEVSRPSDVIVVGPTVTINAHLIGADVIVYGTVRGEVHGNRVRVAEDAKCERVFEGGVAVRMKETDAPRSTTIYRAGPKGA